MRLFAVTAIAVLLASDAASAQTVNAPAVAAEDEHTWSFSLSAYTAGFSVNRANFTGYVFNPDGDKPRFVFAVDVAF